MLELTKLSKTGKRKTIRNNQKVEWNCTHTALWKSSVCKLLNQEGKKEFALQSIVEEVGVDAKINEFVSKHDEKAIPRMHIRSLDE